MNDWEVKWNKIRENKNLEKENPALAQLVKLLMPFLLLDFSISKRTKKKGPKMNAGEGVRPTTTVTFGINKPEEKESILPSLIESEITHHVEWIACDYLRKHGKRVSSK